MKHTAESACAAPKNEYDNCIKLWKEVNILIIRLELKVQITAKYTSAALRSAREWTVSKTTIAQAATVCGVVLLRIISVVGNGGV